MSDSIIKDILLGQGGSIRDPDSNQQLREDLGNLYDLVNAMSKHIMILEKKLKHHEKVWDRIDKDVQLFGNKVIAYGLKRENEDE